MHQLTSTHQIAATVIRRCIHPLGYLTMRRAVKRRLRDISRLAAREQRATSRARLDRATAGQRS